jgi:hypothetical protein
VPRRHLPARTRPGPRIPATRRRSGPSARPSGESWSRSTAGHRGDVREQHRPRPAGPRRRRLVRTPGRRHRPVDGAELPIASDLAT